MNIENLLKYQKVDGELYKLEQRLVQSQYKKKAAELAGIAKQSQVKSTQLENEAEKLSRDIEDIKKNFDINQKKLQQILSTDIENASLQELENLNSLRNKLMGNLNILEKMLQKCAENINRILAEFNKTKKTFDSAREQYAVCKQKMEEESKAILPEQETLKKQLLALEKDVNPSLMAEYKKKRQDNIFPVVVPLENGGFCGRCRMELAKVAISRIKEQGVITCEHCKRFIYSN